LVRQPGENDKGFFEKLEVIHENDNLMKLQNVNWALNVQRFNHLTALVRVVVFIPHHTHNGRW
jgi:hypothetical protein